MPVPQQLVEDMAELPAEHGVAGERKPVDCRPEGVGTFLMMGPQDAGWERQSRITGLQCLCSLAEPKYLPISIQKTLILTFVACVCIFFNDLFSDVWGLCLAPSLCRMLAVWCFLVCLIKQKYVRLAFRLVLHMTKLAVQQGHVQTTGLHKISCFAPTQPSSYGRMILHTQQSQNKCSSSPQTLKQTHTHTMLGYSWHASLWQRPPVCWWPCWCWQPVKRSKERAEEKRGEKQRK